LRQSISPLLAVGACHLAVPEQPTANAAGVAGNEHVAMEQRRIVRRERLGRAPADTTSAIASAHRSLRLSVLESPRALPGYGSIAMVADRHRADPRDRDYVPEAGEELVDLALLGVGLGARSCVHHGRDRP
jgi:hypothetical protein